MICFVSFLIGCESGGTQILITNQSVEKQNQSKQEIYVTFDIQLKSARAILKMSQEALGELVFRISHIQTEKEDTKHRPDFDLITTL